MSLMLFAMGTGSRISRVFNDNLLDTFILTEFSLSILCAVSAVLAYGAASFTEQAELLIYIQAFIIGNLIGFEIPLVTRINQDYEELRVNISNVMEKDYYGALFGGLIFAFVALPHLGLTYTPIVLGAINFIVASVLLWRFFYLLKRKKILVSAFFCVFLFLVCFVFIAKPIITYGEQKKYRDKVIYSQQTQYQKIVMTRWKEYYWLFINGQEQFSTFDEEKYHEPLVHPAIKLSHNASDILIIGGGDGLAAREVFKHSMVKSVTLVDLDPAMTNLAKTHPVIQNINNGSMNDSRLHIINGDAAQFVKKDKNLYGVIIIDLPDPDTVDLMHVYSKQFYSVLSRKLIKGGVMVTQATSPYFSRKAFLCLIKTIRESGFSVLPYHNQIPTMGEWGWIIGVRNKEIDETKLKNTMLKIKFSNIKTRFINQDAMISMVYFGKGVFDENLMKNININTELNPVLYKYYLAGSWGMY